MRKGLFITLEGPEGGGKTTQARWLAEDLQAKGADVVLTREPGGTAVGNGVRSILLDSSPGSISPEAETLLYLAGRAQHAAEVLRPSLHAGRIVVCDRYTDSTLAYQGHARGLGVEPLIAMNDFATGGLRPGLTLLLDIPAEVGLERQREHNRMEAEGLDFHRKVREGFLLLAERWPERVKVVDASQPPGIVRSRLWDIVWGWIR
ncbi:MAG: dTMP kinase [Armatimonadetes bacterium]|nr:dTMP kinase [Armatimonadota bacterium]